jgi:hypothetical protein
MTETNQRILDNCLTAIQEAYDTLTEVRTEEDMAYDDLPESVREGVRGDEMMDAIATLEVVTDSLEDIISNLEDLS